ncbi:MAG: hypothetical protein H8E43_03960 [Planctomycetia bacterium]|nr:hypothetical protein [Planctomycetia bacterium]MBL6915838.1 hypothetical protein [Planctomycetota bacterium]HCW44108.1 hypothetical protein [Planctomycetota bacterium]
MHDLSCKKRNGQDWKILWILEFKNSGAGASNLLTVLETVYGTFDFDLQGVSFPPLLIFNHRNLLRVSGTRYRIQGMNAERTPQRLLDFVFNNDLEKSSALLSSINSRQVFPTETLRRDFHRSKIVYEQVSVQIVRCLYLKRPR